MAERLMLLDTPTLYFRAYFGLPDSIRAPDGMPVNAVRGTLDFISLLVGQHRPDRLIACFDADWRPAFRVAAIPSYKAHRVAEEQTDASGNAEEVPDTLAPQVPVLEEVLDAFGIARGWADGFEADDAIAAYAAAHDGPVQVVTGDRDLFQLVDDARGVQVLYIARGLAKLEVVDEAALTGRYSIPGRGYADFATLRGDPSDGLPGVPGIGEKTAASLISEFGGLAGLQAALDDPASALKPAVRKKLDAARDYLKVAPEVVHVRADAAIVPAESRLPVEPAAPDALERLATRYGLSSPVKRLLTTLADAA
ncbi:MAG TPA: 5'-3' exonuclease H3TH domain-containing protein [Actinocrinis sp.]|nr:5'-3' exonuclease H3TH domain-containing protein [Actinocrinis sp.]